MKEQKKEETVVTEPVKDNNEENAGRPTRSNVLWLIAGFYLLYTAYQLCGGVIRGDEGADLIFMFIGIAFGVIGAVLLYSAAKNMYKADKIKKEQEAAEAAQIESGAAVAEETEVSAESVEMEAEEDAQQTEE